MSFKAVFADVGQGDSTLLELPDGRFMLVDVYRCPGNGIDLFTLLDDVLPDGDVAEEGYTVIRDALREQKKAAIGQLTLRGKENLVAVYPGGSGLVVDTLRYASEIKDADEIFSDISRGKPRADMISMAQNLIEQRTEPFEPQKFKNHYAEALRDLVQFQNE